MASIYVKKRHGTGLPLAIGVCGNGWLCVAITRQIVPSTDRWLHLGKEAGPSMLPARRSGKHMKEDRIAGRSCLAAHDPEIHAIMWVAEQGPLPGTVKLWRR